MVKKTSELARKFFTENKNKTYVTNTELHEYIRERNNQSSRVISGTLDGTGVGKLISFPWYTQTWHKEKLSSGRIVHRKHKKTEDGVACQRENNYDTPAKRKAASRIMSYLPKEGNPKLLTLASSSGNCVVEATTINPNVVIFNVEKEQSILNLWKTRKKKLKVKTRDYQCSFQSFIKLPRFTDNQYALLNLDAMGYISKKLGDCLQVVNTLQNCKYVAVTAQKLNNFRNTGKFIDDLRVKYKGIEDKHGKCICDCLSNYTLIDRFTYQKDDGTRNMEVFIFKLGGKQ